MKKSIKIVAILTLILMLALTATACLGKDVYSSKAKKVKTSIDDSVALIEKNEMELLNTNPDRGLRMETHITLGDPLDGYPGNNEDPFEKAKNMFKKYKSDSATLSQVYVYLTNYYNKPIDELAFTQLKTYFELFEKYNIRMLLRFAYSHEDKTDDKGNVIEEYNKKDATYQVMNGHISQIRDFFNQNKQLIDDTLYCLQLGMIGWWGEGHHNENFNSKDTKNLITDMVSLVDDGMYIQVRTMDLYKSVPSKYKNIVGMHDDYVIDDPNDPWAFYAKEWLNYNSVMKKFSNTINDGEMPWGNATLGDQEGAVTLNSMDGRKIMQRMADHTFTSFSLEHNYRENGREIYSMAKWKNEYLTYDEAIALDISVNPYLFELCGGKMNIYDIIKYHLGYQLTLSNVKMQGNEFKFTISNYGWAAPLKMGYLGLVVEEDGVNKEYPITAYEKEKLQAGTTIEYSVRIPLGTKCVGVRMATSKDSNYAVRFANGTSFVDGVQYFK